MKKMVLRKLSTCKEEEIRTHIHVHIYMSGYR